MQASLKSQLKVSKWPENLCAGYLKKLIYILNGQGTEGVNGQGTEEVNGQHYLTVR